ncbi:outer dense fiber protein 3 [Harpegnathos saltator]|uniref:Outer dense fiber protein 3 n=1 Tax=Harpegnathos saltator TaxID=610380 RepID=E2C5F6_HARSA|nr:outer dense fiber protein 3 [Harpegnathos saltator]EFN76769.1 Outer dense fiber protein 3 [Harpegnathos saltator]
MEDKEGKVPSCRVKGPGPVYKLPTLTGYTGHDPSRHRNPAYTIRPKISSGLYLMGPGPRYNVSKLTKFGQDRSPAYSIKGRETMKLRDLGPGPGAYSPELCPPINHSRRAPAYSIKTRDQIKLLETGPSPNTYLLPTCIGPKVPDKPAQGAFSITGHHEIRGTIIGPGPAAYTKLDYNLVKRRSPAYSLKGRHILSEKYPTTPAPTFYPLYDTRKRAPEYSFGVKHSECTGVPITQQDED